MYWLHPQKQMQPYILCIQKQIMQQSVLKNDYVPDMQKRPSSLLAEIYRKLQIFVSKFNFTNFDPRIC